VIVNVVARNLADILHRQLVTRTDQIHENSQARTTRAPGALMMAYTGLTIDAYNPEDYGTCLVAPFNACPLPSRLQGRTPRG